MRTKRCGCEGRALADELGPAHGDELDRLFADESAADPVALFDASLARAAVDDSDDLAAISEEEAADAALELLASDLDASEEGSGSQADSSVLALLDAHPGLKITLSR